MSILSPIISVFSWFKKVFVNHTVSAASVAVTVTETIKTLLANPITGFLLNIADAVTGTQVSTNVAAAINQGIIKVLAVELAIQGLPDNPTADQILAFENQIIGAFNINANNSKLYTVLAAQVYGIVQSNVANGKINFADWVDAVEAAYLDYQTDLATNAVVVPTQTAAVSDTN